MHWKCLNCGAAMNHRTARQVELRSGIPIRNTLHVCGVCRHLHLCDERERLRELTVAERFRVETKFADELNLSVSKERPTLIIPREPA